jgi:hypothetical protein
MTATSKFVHPIDHDANPHRAPTARPYSILSVPSRASSRAVLFLPHPNSRGGIAYLSALWLKHER